MVFQSTPAIAGGRICRASSARTRWSCFNPRPAIAGGRIIVWVEEAHGVSKFQSTPAIAGGRILGFPVRGPRLGCFNPRPPLLAGESLFVASKAHHRSVSIHARHCWRANRGIEGYSQHAHEFQSTPAIAGGRIVAAIKIASSYLGFNPRPPLLAGESWQPTDDDRDSYVFQSTPAIAGGRIARAGSMRTARRVFQSTPAIAGGRIKKPRISGAVVHRFNPRPPLLAGESAMRVAAVWRESCFNPRPPLLAGESCGQCILVLAHEVSIHARHCWRANLLLHGAPLSAGLFQSTPAIAGGRIARAGSMRTALRGFNPRPPLLAGESLRM